MFQNVAIIGMGLLGTSLGMALRGKNIHRLCWTRRGEVRQWALQHDAADETGSDIRTILSRADLTVLALPLPQIIFFLKEYAASWRPGSLVTDMGSVKNAILSAAETTLVPRGVGFIGSHPMAGTEKSGFENVFPSLFKNADVFLCPASNTKQQSLDALASFWKSTGARPLVLNAARHDSLVAHTSHVLHVAASALVLAILDSEDLEEKHLRFAGCATGFRDTSRIASSNPVMWREIVEYNAPAILGSLEKLEKNLVSLRTLIAEGRYGEFEARFAAGKALRDEWIQYKGS